MAAPRPVHRSTPRFELLQDGPETFRLLLGDGQVRHVALRTASRRELAPAGAGPLGVARELVAFLLERGVVPPPRGPVDLAGLAGPFPELTEELRARLG